MSERVLEQLGNSSVKHMAWEQVEMCMCLIALSVAAHSGMQESVPQT
jgi:hypothetical protein